MYIIPIPVALNTQWNRRRLVSRLLLCPKALAESLMSDVQAASATV